MNRIIVLFAIALLSISCSETFNQISYKNILTMHSSPTFEGHFYIGSDTTHHYLVEKWKYGKDNKFKVDKKDVTIFKEIAFKSDEIRLCPWNPKKFKVEEFGKTKDTILYKYK